MDQRKSLFLWMVCLICGLSSCASAEGHTDHDDAFDEILKTVNQTESLGLRHLTTLLETLGLHNCSNRTSHHHKCVTADSLFEFYNISNTSSLDETAFANIATVMVYCLLSHENRADGEYDDEPDRHDDRYVKQKVDVYDRLLERYDTEVFCEQILDQLLKDLNDSIGKQLNVSKCFSSHDLLRESNITDGGLITKAHLPDISTTLVSKLLGRHCIVVEQKEPLPCPSFFVHKLFFKYASNDSINEKKIEQLLAKLKIGKHDQHEGTGGHYGGHDHLDHNDHQRHRRHIVTRTSFPSLTVNKILSTVHMEVKQPVSNRYRRHAEDPDDHDDDDEDDDRDHDHNGHEDSLTKSRYEKCYSADELLAIYHVNKTMGFDIKKFKELSPALLHQIESNVCASKTLGKHSSENAAHVWSYGFAAAVVVSLCSVIGVMVIPFVNTVAYNKVIVFLIALAVGTLVGDALLHLLPHAAGLHKGHGESHSGSFHEDEDKSFLWKFLLVVAGVYVFFLFETVTNLFFRRSIGHSHDTELNRNHDQVAVRQHSHAQTQLGGESNGRYANEPVVLMNMANASESVVEQPVNQDLGYTTEKTVRKRHIESVVWMIIFGDAVHNVADGIAMGVAFTNSTFGGISTSIAVLCHELPHELGDFAVLLSSGLTVKEALLANFLSACTCFIGLILGNLTGEIEDANLWIFAITAGFFLYIALADMLPQLMHSSGLHKISKLSILMLQNAGIVTGFIAMLLLAYYEDAINI